MTKKRQILFSVIRGLLAILIALLVATLLIFLSADGSSFSEKLSASLRSISGRLRSSARCSAWDAAAPPLISSA